MQRRDERTPEPGVYRRINPSCEVYLLRIKRGDASVNETYDTYEQACLRKKELLGRWERARLMAHHPGMRPLKDAVERFKQEPAQGNAVCIHNQKTQLDWWAAFFGDKPCSEISEADVQAGITLLMTVGSKRDGKPCSGATGKKYLSNLSVLFKRMRVWGWVKSNPCLEVIKPKVDPGFDRVLTDDEIARLLEACKVSENQGLYLLVRMALETGCRQNELMKLKWRNVDLKQGELTLELGGTKTKRGRSLPVSKEVLGALLNLQNGVNESNFVFTANWNTYRTAWHTAMKRAGIEGYKFHGLRHQAITRWARSGAFTLPEIMQLTGHTTLTCLLRYQHLMPGAAKDKARGLLSV